MWLIYEWNRFTFCVLASGWPVSSRHHTTAGHNDTSGLLCVCVCCRVTVGCNSSHSLFATCMQVHPNRCLVFQNADVIKVCPHLIRPLNIYYRNMHLWHLCLFLSLQCSSDYAPVCGSNGERYENHCLLRKDACKLQTEVLVVSEGACPVGTFLCRRGDCPSCVCVCRWTSQRHLLNWSYENH